MRCVLIFLSGLLAFGQDIVVFDDQFPGGFSSWSWGTVDIQSTETVHSGTYAIRFEPDGWAGIYPQSTVAYSITDYDAITFWLYATGGGGQQLSFTLLLYDHQGGQTLTMGTLDIDSYASGGVIPDGTWLEFVLPFEDMNLFTGSFNGFYIMDATGGDQPAIFIDDISIRRRDGGPPQGDDVLLQGYPDQNRRSIDPRIYGVNTMNPPDSSVPPYPFLRWGGNSSSRYAWDVDAHNVGFDWFYFSYPEANPHPENLPDGSRADRFLAYAQDHSASPLLTLPTIGWVARDRVQRWSFDTGLYGNQEETECTWFSHNGQSIPDWCNPNAGNGIDTSGQPITFNNKEDANKNVDPVYIQNWILHLQQVFGTAAEGGIQYVALDNEPMLWNSTHADVHPEPLGYDELWQMVQDYGSAIKATEPNAIIFGPAVWGWCAYFASAIDSAEGGSCVDGSDRQAHGGQALLEWLLDRVTEYHTQFGVQLIDVLDVHYYPQAGGFVFSDSDSEADQRFQSLRSLYDPTYVDGSWIPDPVQLIPRMKTIISDHAPGMPLALTEYNFGGDNSITSALAQVEALGLFGREGLDIATRWVMPQAGTKVEDAFRLFLDFDGLGSQVMGTSFRMDSANRDEVSGFGIESDTQTRFFIVINKTPLQRLVHVDLADAPGQPLTVYSFDANSSVHLAGEATLRPGGFDWSAPGYSANLIVFAPGPCSHTLSSFFPFWPDAYDAGLDLAPVGSPDLRVNVLDMVLVVDCP